MSSDGNDNRVLGGYKATLHNPNTSVEAKEHAAELLAAHGVEVPKSDLPAPHDHSKHHQDHHHGQHEHHVAHESKHSEPIPDEKDGQTERDHRILGGYKATLNNPNTSEAAKDHAAEVLSEHGVKF